MNKFMLFRIKDDADMEKLNDTVKNFHIIKWEIANPINYETFRFILIQYEVQD